METQALVRGFIADELLHAGANVSLEPDEPLVSTGILDSLGLVKLLLFLEERFGVTIRDQDVVPGNFNTVSLIATFVELKRRQANEPDSSSRRSG
jgi:acyl carrier protein